MSELQVSQAEHEANAGMGEALSEPGRTIVKLDARSKSASYESRKAHGHNPHDCGISGEWYSPSDSASVSYFLSLRVTSKMEKEERKCSIVLVWPPCTLAVSALRCGKKDVGCGYGHLSVQCVDWRSCQCLPLDNAACATTSMPQPARKLHPLQWHAPGATAQMISCPAISDTFRIMLPSIDS